MREELRELAEDAKEWALDRMEIRPGDPLALATLRLTDRVLADKHTHDSNTQHLSTCTAYHRTGRCPHREP